MLEFRIVSSVLIMQQARLRVTLCKKSQIIAVVDSYFWTKLSPKGRKMFLGDPSYLKVWISVKIDNKLTESFTCHGGVKQGCMLSPTLFNFYLRDLREFRNTASSTNIVLSDKYINCLLYADDLAIFSRSARQKLRFLITVVSLQTTTCPDTALINWKTSNPTNILDS